MFLGRSQHSIDPQKGRLIVPTKLRRELGGLFYITYGIDGCLAIFPKNEWETLCEKANSLPMTDAAGRRFLRVIFGGAIEAEPDNQWRVAIPEHLREYAHIDKDIYLVGVGTRLEIWAKEVLDSSTDMDKLDDELLKKMAELGI